MTVDFILNGEDVSMQLREGERLSEILRKDFKIHGVRGECMTGRCGRCIVLMNGIPVNSCLVPAFRARGSEIVTPEGFALTDEYRDVSAGFAREGLHPCVFCSGAVELISSTIADETFSPDDELILLRMSVIECRCTQPSVIIRAVKAVADIRSKRIYSRALQ